MQLGVCQRFWRPPFNYPGLLTSVFERHQVAPPAPGGTHSYDNTIGDCVHNMPEAVHVPLPKILQPVFFPIGNAQRPVSCSLFVCGSHTFLPFKEGQTDKDDPLIAYLARQWDSNVCESGLRMYLFFSGLHST